VPRENTTLQAHKEQNGSPHDEQQLISRVAVGNLLPGIF
jgi:hypothetical protein